MYEQFNERCIRILKGGKNQCKRRCKDGAYCTVHYPKKIEDVNNITLDENYKIPSTVQMVYEEIFGSSS